MPIPPKKLPNGRAPNDPVLWGQVGIQGGVAPLENINHKVPPANSQVATVNGDTGNVTVPAVSAGGAAGDVLTKTTATDYDYAWAPLPTPPVGEMYLTANTTATTVSATNTWYKAAGTTSDGELYLFTDGGGKLTYTGTKTVSLRCLACISVYSAGTNDTLGVAIFKNGVIVASSEMEVRTTAAGQAVQAACQGMVTFTTNDYVEVYVENKSATADITMHYLNFICK